MGREPLQLYAAIGASVIPCAHPAAEAASTSRREHVIHRALERFGVTLSFDDLDRLEALIASGEAEHLGADPHNRGRAFYAIVLPGEVPARAVWSAGLREILTLLAREMRTARRQKHRRSWRR